MTLEELCSYLRGPRFSLALHKGPALLNAKKTLVVAYQSGYYSVIYQGNNAGRFKSPKFGNIKSLALSHALGNDEWLVFYDDTDFWIIRCDDWRNRICENFQCNNEEYEAVKMSEFQVLNKASGELRPGGLPEDGV